MEAVAQPAAAAPAVASTHIAIPTQAASFISGPLLHGEISDRKREVMAKSLPYLLSELAYYSPCQTEGCECVGWRQSGVSHKDCANCDHGKDGHISHLIYRPEAEIRRLFGYLYDAETLRVSILTEQHEATRDVFILVRNILLNAVHEATEICVLKNHWDEVPLEVGVKKIVAANLDEFGEESYKVVWVARNCLVGLGHWRLNPALAFEELTADEFKKWMLLCYIPVYCDSMKIVNPVLVFGRDFFKKVFPLFKTEIIDALERRLEAGLNVGIALPDQLPELAPSIYATFLNLVSDALDHPDSPVWVPAAEGDENAPVSLKLLDYPLFVGPVPPEGRKMIEEKIGKYLEKLTPEQKARMTADKVTSLREMYIKQYRDLTAPNGGQPQQ